MPKTTYLIMGQDLASTRQTRRHSPKAIFEKNVTRLDIFARVIRHFCEFGASGLCLNKTQNSPKNFHNPYIPSLPKFGKNLMDPPSGFSNRVHLCWELIDLNTCFKQPCLPSSDVMNFTNETFHRVGQLISSKFGKYDSA